MDSNMYEWDAIEFDFFASSDDDLDTQWENDATIALTISTTSISFANNDDSLSLY